MQMLILFIQYLYIILQKSLHFINFMKFMSYLNDTKCLEITDKCVYAMFSFFFFFTLSINFPLPTLQNC